MKSFSAFHYGGPHDGQLSLFYGGFTARNFEFIAISMVDGEPGAIFKRLDVPADREHYITGYKPMVRAARKALQGAI